MNVTGCPDRETQLHASIDGELSPAEAAALAAHLATCAGCRAALASLQALRAAVHDLSREFAPPHDLWPKVKAGIAGASLADVAPALLTGEAGGDDPLPRRSIDPALPAFSSDARTFGALRWLPPLAIAAALVVGFILVERHSPAAPDAAWSVASVSGAPRIGAEAVSPTSHLQLGDWLETDATSRAKVAVGTIGEVNVEPNSRLRLTGITATDHRLELARGTLRALIWAPPRLFFVDTPSATAVDLGCAYTLTVDDHGGGELQVTSGYVALDHDGRETIIPAGLMCLTRRGAGPGTPFAADASAVFRAALEEFDFAGTATRADALAAVLAAARVDDAITLWHLLTRTTGKQVGEVFDALEKLHPAPAGVTRPGILAGDPAMRRAWAADLGLNAR